MPAKDHEADGDAPRGGSGFVAFWTSLPGVLTGVAALITALATLAALDFGDGGSGPTTTTTTGAPASAASPAVPGTTVAPCLRDYFEGVPGDRVAPVEAGTADFDVIQSNQPKAGTIGLEFTSNGAPIGAMRIAFFPANSLFKIESVVDEECRQLTDYANVSRGGDRNVLQNFDTVRLRFDGDMYDLRIGASTTVRLGFVPYVP